MSNLSSLTEQSSHFKTTMNLCFMEPASSFQPAHFNKKKKKKTSKVAS